MRAEQDKQTRTVFIHVDGVRSSRFGFRVGVDFTRTKTADVVYPRTRTPRAGETKVFVVLGLCLVEELLVALQTLGGGSADLGSNGAPLGGHEFGEVEEFFIFGLEKKVGGRNE